MSPVPSHRTSPSNGCNGSFECAPRLASVYVSVDEVPTLRALALNQVEDGEVGDNGSRAAASARQFVADGDGGAGLMEVGAVGLRSDGESSPLQDTNAGKADARMTRARPFGRRNFFSKLNGEPRNSKAVRAAH